VGVELALTRQYAFDQLGVRQFRLHGHAASASVKK
jgi:hypothetical protein